MNNYVTIRKNSTIKIAALLNDAAYINEFRQDDMEVFNTARPSAADVMSALKEHYADVKVYIEVDAAGNVIMVRVKIHANWFFTAYLDNRAAFEAELEDGQYQPEEAETETAEEEAPAPLEKPNEAPLTLFKLDAVPYQQCTANDPEEAPTDEEIAIHFYMEKLDFTMDEAKSNHRKYGTKIVAVDIKAWALDEAIRNGLPEQMIQFFDFSAYLRISNFVNEFPFNYKGEDYLISEFIPF